MNTFEKPADLDDYRRSHLDRGANYDASICASPFDAYMAAWERRHIPRIVGKLFPRGLDRYLDFACGTGRITEQIAPLARQATAVDISPTMIAEARRKCPATRFHLGDLTTTDPELGRFDLVSSFRFLGNAQDELRRAALGAIAKRVVPGGYLLVNNHRNPRALYALLGRLAGGESGQMDLDLPKLRALLGDFGFDIVHMQPIGVWMHRARTMVSARADDERSVRNERRFGSPNFAHIAPDLIVAARKR